MKIQGSDVLNHSWRPVKKGNEVKFEKVLNDSINSNSKTVSSQDVENFKQSLSELGASGYIAAMNSQKIEQKLAAKRKELSQLLGLDDPSKSKDEQDGLKNVLEKLLQEYKKELNVALNSSVLLEKQQKLSAKNSSLNLTSLLVEFGI